MRAPPDWDPPLLPPLLLGSGREGENENAHAVGRRPWDRGPALSHFSAKISLFGALGRVGVPIPQLESPPKWTRKGSLV